MISTMNYEIIKEYIMIASSVELFYIISCSVTFFYTCVLKTNIQYIGLSDSDTALYANTCLCLNLQDFSQIYSSSFCEKNQSHALKYIFNKTLQIFFGIFQHIFNKKSESAYSDKRKNSFKWLFDS